MSGARGAARRRVSVLGADAVLDSFVADPMARRPGEAAARALLRATVDWRSIRADVVTAECSVILGERDGGPVLAARFFAPYRSTTVHDHGHAGAALVVEGRDRYERFTRLGAARARLESVRELSVGDAVWWDEPPDDLHRQTGLGSGSMELVLVAGPLVEPTSFAVEDR